MLEQPGNSVLEFYPAFRYVVTQLAQIHGGMAAAGVSDILPIVDTLESPRLLNIHSTVLAGYNYIGRLGIQRKVIYLILEGPIWPCKPGLSHFYTPGAQPQIKQELRSRDVREAEFQDLNFSMLIAMQPQPSSAEQKTSPCK